MSALESNFVKLRSVRGWLFDVYPSGTNKMAVWIITENGKRIRLVDRFTYNIYVSGDWQEIKKLSDKIQDSTWINSLCFARKNADFMTSSKEKVLEISVHYHRRASVLAEKILRYGGYEHFQLYNVDIPAPQAYFYSKGLFPLAHVMIIDSGSRLSYDVLDSVESVDYAVPTLRSMWLDAEIEKTGIVLRFTDRIGSIRLESDKKAILISEGDERDKLLELVRAVRSEDPDIVLTHGGDSFLFPYLAYRACVNSIADSFVLSREDIPLAMWTGKGRSFFSYGRVYHKSPLHRLYGRVHIDVDNTFIYTACGLDGLIELSRTCRVPLQTASRASIGTIMSSLQLYTAWKEDTLIPWKKTEPESFKSGWELFVADRGGFIYEPKVGFHTDVVEVDFASMFPMLMLKHNISAETVLCGCCPDSQTKVPELGYNICEKRKGIVPKTLDLLLRKRSKYKGLMKEASDQRLRQAYDMRQAALKWILVTCFGYLGYRNARFGKVDAHISVCAFAREALLKTTRIAEERGFEVLHGIVDSLWLKKPGVSPAEVKGFCQETSKEVGVPLNVEGKYRWIVFLPSKVLEDVPVLNRYYGVFEDGRIKTRGIEARRGDTPMIICNAQLDMIQKLSAASDFEGFQAKIPEALAVLKDYADKLVKKEVNMRDLLITKRLSKSSSRYAHNVSQAIAAKQLEEAGFEVHSGQTVQYIIVDSRSGKISRRVLAAQLLTPDTKYDARKYLDLLASAGETLLGIFGYTKDSIQTAALHRMNLNPDSSKLKATSQC